MNRTLDVATSFLASAPNYPLGIKVGSLGPRPEKLLELYEFEACPFCRKVRLALTILDLDAMVYPCPKSGTRFRPVAIERGGKHQFPYLVDPNTGTSMYESNDIVTYLFGRYGNGRVPLGLAAGPLTSMAAMLSSAARPGRGGFTLPSIAPVKPLELWSFESSPYCRIAREALCSLEIPYVLHNVGKGSVRREAFIARSGTMRVPFLVDPNTSVEMFESADIVRYLEKNYRA